MENLAEQCGLCREKCGAGEGHLLLLCNHGHNCESGAMETVNVTAYRISGYKGH